ncbi:hypothetical protein IGI04_030473 [Brassica rapa subsp. trilocularis]|uniref:Uncharacterized protein n=1 Tax=Brassica rapa subsp. trilocularis TaxID=1813537 RepID=A0ABQ7LRP0_BRACM|nr:hypothetical protein IGI04_030473 [Brassica rapa subsp. trilocularis]
MGNKSGYGSEPGYRGDVELGYGDEYDDEEEDVKLLFWGASNFGIISSDAPAFDVVLNFLLPLVVPLLMYLCCNVVSKPFSGVAIRSCSGFERVKSRTEVRTEVKFWYWKNQVKFVCLYKILRTLN